MGTIGSGVILATIDGSIVTIGITDHAQSQIGDVVYVELPEADDELSKGEPFGTIESTKAVSDLFAPLSGRVVEVNDALADSPETVNEDPYGDGWMLRIEVSDSSEVEGMMNAEDYAGHVESEQA